MKSSNANGTLSEMESKNSSNTQLSHTEPQHFQSNASVSELNRVFTAQNKVLDSEQIHSEQLDFPDGCKYLDENKITMDIRTTKDDAYIAAGVFLFVGTMTFSMFFPEICRRLDLSIHWGYYTVFFLSLSIYPFYRILKDRTPDDYLVLDKVNKSIYLYEKVEDTYDKLKSVYLSFEEIKFIAIDSVKDRAEAEYEFDYGKRPLVSWYTVNAISNDNKLLRLTGRTDDFQKIDRFGKYLADLTNSEFIEYPGDGNELRMIGSQPVYRKHLRSDLIVIAIIIIVVVCLLLYGFHYESKLGYRR